MPKKRLAAAVAVCLALIACGGDVRRSPGGGQDPTPGGGQDPVSGPPVLPSVVAVNAPTYLKIPLDLNSADSAGSFVVHPSIVDFGVSTWNGHRYWMAITPFTPTEEKDVENPSIYYSDDGDTWSVPAGLANPIDRPDPGWADSDPDLFVGPDNRLYCVYREYTSPSQERLYFRSSADGVTWSERSLIAEHQGGALPIFLISPSIVYTDGVYYMWTSNNYSLELRVGSSLTTLGSAQPTTFGTANPAALYHNDVIWYNGKFRAVIQDGLRGLRYAESYDGQEWAMSPNCFLNLGAPGQWDDIWMYRATFTPTPTGYDLWYSARGTGAESAFRFGRTKMTVTPWAYIPF